MQLLSRRQLQKLSSEWQLCVLQSLKVLTSDLLLEKAIHKVDEVIVASLPLLFVGRHGNKFTGSVADALADSALARDHPMLGRLQEVLEMEGGCGLVGVGVWVCICVWGVGVWVCVEGRILSSGFFAVFLPFFLVVWQTSCSRSGSRDPQYLSDANDAMFRHLGGQLAQLEPGRMQHMVTLHES